VTQETAQTIAFAKPKAVTYGAKPITLSASASSKLPVTFSVLSGPGTISGHKLTITGAGAIVIKASQAGNGTYAPAAVTQTLTVNKAALIVTAANTTWTAGKSGQSLAGFTITGFVDGDTKARVFGAEAAGLSCPSVDASDPRAGSYVINITKGTLLTPANYTLTFRKGTLTVHKAAQAAIIGGVLTPPGRQPFLLAAMLGAGGGQQGVTDLAAQTRPAPAAAAVPVGDPPSPVPGTPATQGQEPFAPETLPAGDHLDVRPTVVRVDQAPPLPERHGAPSAAARDAFFVELERSAGESGRPGATHRDGLAEGLWDLAMLLGPGGGSNAGEESGTTAAHLAAEGPAVVALLGIAWRAPAEGPGSRQACRQRPGLPR
jgi:hypothetical protein